MTPRQRAFIHGVAGMAALGVAFVYAWPYVAPFLLAIFLAAVIDPVVRALHDGLGIGRGCAVVLVLTLSIALLGGAVALIAANLNAELEGFLEALPDYAMHVRQYVDTYGGRIERWMAEWSPAFGDVLRFNPDQWTGLAAGATKAVLGALKGAPHALFVVFVGGLATYFISKDRHKLWQQFLQTIPSEWRASVVRFRDEIMGGALGIVRAQLTLIGMTAVASVVGLALVGVPYAWALGLLAGLLDLAPFLGPGTVFIPMGTVYLLQGQLVRGLTLFILCMLIVLARQLVEPHMFGAQLGLHPVTTLIALYIGVQALGVVGFIVGPLTLIVVKAFFVVMVAPE